MTWVVQVLNSLGARVLLFCKTSRVAVRPTLPPLQWYHVSFWGVKCPDCEAGHSLLPSTDVKNEWRTPCVLSWHGQGQFYVCLTLQYEITMYEES
jgi:hypothetical protein